jgi:hypothetical protein
VIPDSNSAKGRRALGPHDQSAASQLQFDRPAVAQASLERERLGHDYGKAAGAFLNSSAHENLRCYQSTYQYHATQW